MVTAFPDEGSTIDRRLSTGWPRRPSTGVRPIPFCGNRSKRVKFLASVLETYTLPFAGLTETSRRLVPRWGTEVTASVVASMANRSSSGKVKRTQWDQSLPATSSQAWLASSQRTMMLLIGTPLGGSLSAGFRPTSAEGGGGGSPMQPGRPRSYSS